MAYVNEEVAIPAIVKMLSDVVFIRLDPLPIHNIIELGYTDVTNIQNAVYASPTLQYIQTVEVFLFGRVGCQIYI